MITIREFDEVSKQGLMPFVYAVERADCYACIAVRVLYGRDLLDQTHLVGAQRGLTPRLRYGNGFSVKHLRGLSEQFLGGGPIDAWVGYGHSVLQSRSVAVQRLIACVEVALKH